MKACASLGLLSFQKISFLAANCIFEQPSQLVFEIPDARNRKGDKIRFDVVTMVGADGAVSGNRSRGSLTR